MWLANKGRTIQVPATQAQPQSGFYFTAQSIHRDGHRSNDSCHRNVSGSGSSVTVTTWIQEWENQSHLDKMRCHPIGQVDRRLEGGKIMGSARRAVRLEQRAGHVAVHRCAGACRYGLTRGSNAPPTCICRRPGPKIAAYVARRCAKHRVCVEINALRAAHRHRCTNCCYAIDIYFRRRRYIASAALGARSLYKSSGAASRPHATAAPQSASTVRFGSTVINRVMAAASRFQRKGTT